MCQGGKPDTGKFHSSYIGMNVCGSAYENGCVVNGMCATATDLNRRRACAVRVVVLCVCVSVTYSPTERYVASKKRICCNNLPHRINTY